MNQLKFIKKVIYGLKRRYNIPIKIIYRVNESLDIETGRREVESNSIYVKKAILLPNRLERDFVYNLTFIATNKNFTYGADFDFNHRSILIDIRDLPKDFELKRDHWLVYYNKTRNVKERYEIETIDRYDEYQVYAIVAKQVTSIQPYDVINNTRYQTIDFEQQVSVEKVKNRSLNQSLILQQEVSEQYIPRDPINLTANTDLVFCCPYQADLIANESPNIANDRDYLEDSNLFRIRQTGNIESIKISINTVPTSLTFGVRRFNGTTFDLVGSSGDISGLLVADQVQTVTLPSPISVEEGDFYTIHTGSFFSDTRLEGIGGYPAGNTLKWFTQGGGLAPDPYDFRTDGTSASGVVLPIEIYTQAPSLVHIGDSRLAGHPTHSTYLEQTDSTDIEITVAYKLKQLNSATYQNMSIGLQTVQNVLDRVNTDIIALKPKAVICEVGVNDVVAGTSIEDFTTRYQALVDACVNEGIVFIALSIGPWNNRSDNDDAILIDEYNSIIKSIIHDKTVSQARFADYRASIGEDDLSGPTGNLWNTQSAYDNDGVHYNSDGNDIIANIVNGALS